MNSWRQNNEDLETERTDEIIVIAENNGLHLHACLLSSRRHSPIWLKIEISLDWKLKILFMSKVKKIIFIRNIKRKLKIVRLFLGRRHPPIWLKIEILIYKGNRHIVINKGQQVQNKTWINLMLQSATPWNEKATEVYFSGAISKTL